jgi:hypothetical protein
MGDNERLALKRKKEAVTAKGSCSGEFIPGITSKASDIRRDGETMGNGWTVGRKTALAAMALMIGVLPNTGMPTVTAAASDASLYGNFEDWDGGVTNQAEATNRMERIKVVNRDGKLYVMASGQEMGRSKTLYLNADNDTSTGANIAGWKDSAGIDYKIEERDVYAFENGDWVQQGQVSLQDSDTVAEYEIDLAALAAAAPAGKIKVGLLSDGAMLPELGELMVAVQPSSSGGAVQEAPPAPADLTIDGNDAEWANVPELLRSPDGKTTVKYAVSADALHMLIEGRIDNGEFPDLWEHLLIDVDRKPATGTAMWAWANTLGSEYLVQSGLLYQANGSGGWQEAATDLNYARSGTGDAKTIEWSLPLADLGTEDTKAVHIAFLSNNYAMPDPAGDPAEISLVAKPQLTVDGDTSDWAGIQPLTVTADGLTTVKTYVADGQLYALIDGRIDNAEFPNLWEHLFLDTDKNPTTGTSSWAWAGKLGAEYLVQTAILYASNGSGGWDQTSTVFPYISTGTGDHKVIEWSVPLSELGINDEQSIHAGFLSNSYVSPEASGDPAVIPLRSSDSVITVDGDDNDWSEVEVGATASGEPYLLDAVQDEQKLYVRVKGQNLDLRSVYYLNTDGDSTTGASVGRWTEDGFDYKIDRGTLYEYQQQDGEWEEKGPVYLAASDDSLEINVYLDDLGLDAPAPIKLGFVNREMLQLPMGGTSLLTVDNTVQTHANSGVFYPRQSFELLNNPYMGWVAWAKDSSKPDESPYPQQHSLVYAGITWRELEPVKGQFNWEAIEQKYQFNYWTSQGKRINLRIVLDTPTSDPAHKDIPDWLYDELAAEGDAGTWYDTQEVGSGFSPNYNSSTLLAEHERMIAKVAQRYDTDERVAYVQLGSLGHWGEWHTWPSGSGVFPKLSISDQYVQHYLNAFTHKQIGMRKPFPIASEQQTGLFNDVFGIKSSTDEWVGWTQNGWASIGESLDNPADAAAEQAASAMPDFWKYAYSGGEFANGNPESWLTDDAIMESLRQLRVSHTSWLGPSSPARTAYGTEIQSNIETMHKMMGYRYIVEAIKHVGSVPRGVSTDVETVINNKGVAPFYQDWKLEYSLAAGDGTVVYKQQQDTDLRTLLPGRHVLSNKINVPNSLAAGSYKLLIAVIDPATNAPGMKLAIDGERSDGRYEVGSLNVTGSTSNGGNGSTPSTPTPVPEDNSVPNHKTYTDVPGSHWAAEAIQELAAKKIMNGVDADRFAPNRSVTRAEFAAILARITGIGVSEGSDVVIPFKDVPANAWYTHELADVFAAGLINGYGDTFKPEAGITREELAVLAVRAVEKAAVEAGVILELTGEADADPYSDKDSISGWAEGGVRQARQLGLLLGDTNGSFRPQDSVSRAEAAVMVVRLLGLLPK